jgi:hypothetical protein
MRAVPGVVILAAALVGFAVAGAGAKGRFFGLAAVNRHALVTVDSRPCD